jgi:ATP-binding cassette subfamily F protein 2
MPPPPKAALPKNPKKEAQRLAALEKAAAAGRGDDSSSETVVTPSPTPPPSSTTPSLKAGDVMASAAALAKEKKFKTRLDPEDFPDISVTCGTNPKKVHPMSKDINVEGLTITFHGQELVQDSTLTLAHGQRYGLVGQNGVGKTTLLNVVASRMLPIPKTIDVYSVHHPVDPSDLTALQAVLQVDEERAELEAEADALSEQMGSDSLAESESHLITDRMNDIYERLDQLDASTSEARAANILTGLGFTAKTLQKKTCDFSGGWRMRIALARALFINPTLLVLDSPTAHLDMESVLYLEEYLKKYSKILLLVSHSQDFLNEVCTNIILLRQKKLTVFGGNYAMYMFARKRRWSSNASMTGNKTRSST